MRLWLVFYGGVPAGFVSDGRRKAPFYQKWFFVFHFESDKTYQVHYT